MISNPWKCGEVVTCVHPGASLELERGKQYVVDHCVGGMVTLMGLPHRAFLLESFSLMAPPIPKSVWTWLRQPAL